MRVIFQYLVYKNDQNRYSVAKYKCLDANKTVTCVGFDLPDIKIPYNFDVEEIEDKKYGKQYKVIGFTEDISNTETDVIEYLSSKLFVGIGKAMAKRIYEMYGDKTLEIIDQYPDELLKVKGISKAKLDKIVTSYKENHKYRDMMAFLQPFGFNANQIVKICDALGSVATKERIQANPYIICDIRGFTFDHAERMKQKFGIRDTADIRLRAAVLETIKGGFANGCVSMTKDQLLRGMNKLLRLHIPDAGRLMWDMVKTMLEEKTIRHRKVKEGDKTLLYFYIPNILEKENALTSYVMENVAIVPVSINIDALIDECSTIDLDDSQRKAIRGVFSNTLSIITGGAGVGKTTTIQTVSAIYKKLNPTNEQIFLAPTGRAARRITESTGKRAQTIHSYLNLVALDDESTYVKEDVTIHDSLVIIDEFSMVDMPIAMKLFESLKQNNTVVIVGDPEQLMSVGIGSVLHDMIKSGAIPVFALTVEHRQQAGSVLISNSNKIRRGETDIVAGNDFEIISIQDDRTEASLQALEDALVDATVREVKKYGIDNVVCLSPYKKYAAGTISLNKRLQAILNPVNEEYYSMKGTNDTYFRPGDIVMHLINDYDEGVMNGDIGHVIGIDKEDNDYVMYVKYIDEKGKDNIVEYRKKNIDELQLAYACTVHKAQGSEYKSVVTCCSNFHVYAKRKNMLYTAVTRAKEHVVLFGNMDCIAETIQNNVIDDRNTMLDYNLRHFNDPKPIEIDKSQFPEFCYTGKQLLEAMEQLRLPV